MKKIFWKYVYDFPTKKFQRESRKRMLQAYSAIESIFMTKQIPNEEKFGRVKEEVTKSLIDTNFLWKKYEAAIK